jgi:serine/threonine-protein kinase ATR
MQLSSPDSPLLLLCLFMFCSDCLFGKGLTLEKPERVPFRLTPNMVDALGICGVEGLFSSSAEVAMQVMRSNEQTMMSVLHTFIYDPLVEWKNTTPGGITSPLAMPAGTGVGVMFHPNAVKILDEIEMKLRGQVAKESLPLNVHGQVAQLIKEATSPANLAQMYIGWMAWL